MKLVEFLNLEQDLEHNDSDVSCASAPAASDDEEQDLEQNDSDGLIPQCSCIVCNKNLQSEVCLSEHILGKKHRRRTEAVKLTDKES